MSRNVRRTCASTGDFAGCEAVFDHPLVSGQQAQLFKSGLGDQQPVERISVQCRQGSRSYGMFRLHWQQMDSSPPGGGQHDIRRDRQLAESELDRHFPDGNRAQPAFGLGNHLAS